VQQQALLARLDAAPLSRFHWRVLIVAGLGWLFDAMDVLLISFIVVAVRPEFSLSATDVGLVLSAGFLGMFFGAAVSGRVADRFGRRGVVQVTILVFAVGSLLCAFAWDLGSLLLFRFITGLGLGGELPVVSTLVSELSPRATRGRMIVLLESFWAYGTIAAALIGTLVIPSFGWRAAFVVGALPALYVVVLRRLLPESPRYLLRQGRIGEAESIVRAAETGAPARAVEAPPAEPQRVVLSELWSRRFARRTLMLWLLWFGIVLTFYGMFGWVPSLLEARGLTMVRSFEFTLVAALAQVPGYFSAAWLVERWGRKPTLVTYLTGSGVAALLFGQAGTGTDALLWLSLLSFFNLGAWGVVYTYSPELYPTAIRASGAGTAAAVGRVGGILGPYLTPVLVPVIAQSGTFAVFMALLLLTAAAVLVLGEETRGRSLEQLAAGSTVATPS
jgi:putative MFS transporter